MTIRWTTLRLLQFASVAAVALLHSSKVFALSPDLRLGQLHQKAWTAQDGTPSGIWSMAQTSDGYLWIAANAGLYRYDGVRFERIDGVGGQRLPSTNVMKLFAPRTGGLWIGYRLGGASFINHGTVTSYGEHEGLPPASVTNFAQDASGALWAGTSRGLKRFNGTHWEDRELDAQSQYVEKLHVARDGTLWIIAGRTVMTLRPGQTSFVAAGIEMSDEQPDFLETPDGTLWLTDQMLGARAVYDPNRTTPARDGWTAVRGSDGRPLFGRLIDRDGTLWLTSATGIVRLKNASRLLDPVHSNADFLPRDYGMAWTTFFEDREGNVWIGTSNGIERFRESRLTQVEFPRATDGYALTAGDSGKILAGIDYKDGVYEVTEAGATEVAGAPQYVNCAYRANDGVVWLGGRGMLWRSSGSKWIPMALPVDTDVENHPVQAILKDKAGRLWVSVIRAGTFRFDGRSWTRVGDTALTLATDADGNVWLGFPRNRILVFDPHTDVVREFSPDDGLEVGEILSIHETSRDVMWVGGELGFARFDGSRFHPVKLRGGKSWSSVTGSVMTSAGELWLGTGDGAMRIAANEVRRLSADPHHAVAYELFDLLDGMRGTPNSIRPLPSIVAGTDGRLWFATVNGIFWIDPKHVSRNTLAPNVDVQTIIADGQRYLPGANVMLPIGVRNLQIDYTAPSLSIPERVKFRYQLGADEPWQDAGARRTAYFTDLDPGDYNFRVIAANEDGIWNETGAAINFTVPPAFYQTRWFFALCVLAFAGLLGVSYRVRMRQVAAQVRGRLEARLAERERIARDLHDTLLQGMQGLIWRFQAATDRIPSEEPSRQLMEQSLDRADKLLGESRDKVKELRPATDPGDLSLALAAEGEQFADLHPANFKVSVQGMRRDLHPIVREEGFLVSREALSNAFRHAQASNIEVELTYDDGALRVRIRDDGRGINNTILEVGARPGHFGLMGMRERAKKLGAHLDIWSRPGAGTEVELRVPADVAYRQLQTQSRGIRSWLAVLNPPAQEH